MNTFRSSKKKVAEIIEDPKLEGKGGPIWKQKIPVAWTFFMHCLCGKHDNLTSVRDMFSEAKKRGFKEIRIAALFEFFSQAAAVVVFHDRFEKLEVDEAVQDDVILNPP